MLTKKNTVAFNGLLLGLLVAVLTGCNPPGPKALLDGKRLLDKGKPEAAVARLEVATQLMVTNAHAWNFLGIAYHQTGQSSNAIAAYKRALAVDPDLVEPRLNLGSLWMELGRYADAHAEFTAYNLRRPKAPEGFSKMALAELNLRQFAAAEQHVRKSLQLESANPDAWNTLGLIQLQQGKARDAAKSFGGALQQQPDFAPALINLAVVAHQQLGDRTGALKYYRQYLKLKPQPADADSVAAVVAQLENELTPPRPKPGAAPTTAVPSTPVPVAPPVVAKTEVAPKPASPSPTPPSRPAPSNPAPVARVQPERSTPPAARVPAEPEVKVAPVVDAPAPRVTAPPAPVVASTASEERGAAVTDSVEVSTVERSSRRPGVTPLPPPRNAVFVESTTATESGGDSTSGEGSATSAARVTAERFATKGSKAMSLKRYVEAADAYGAAAKADPGWYQAHFNHAAAAIEAGRTTEALAACQQALELKPSSAEARYNYALALKQAGRFAEAAGQLERVVSADAKNARAHLSLGNLYADQLRQTDKARAHYLSVLEIDPRHPQAGAIHFWLRANPPR